MGVEYVFCVKLNNGTLGANQEVRNHFGQGSPEDEGDGEFSLKAKTELVESFGFKPWTWKVNYNIKYPEFLTIETDMKMRGDPPSCLRVLVSELLQYGQVAVTGDNHIIFPEEAVYYYSNTPNAFKHTLREMNELE